MLRRDILKSLLGAPVALLAGGIVLDAAGHVEEHQGQALIVPDQGAEIVRATSMPDEQSVTLYQAALPSGDSGLYQSFESPLLIDGQHDAWIHVQRPPGASQGYVLVHLMVSNIEGQIQGAVVTKGFGMT